MIVPSSSTPALSAATNIDPNPNKTDGSAALVGGSSLLADAGPSGTLVDVASTTSTSQISTYLVKDGDTLSEIAQMFSVSINTIVWANDLGSTKAIHPGQTLVILPITGVEHTVVKGETVASIAKKFKGDANEIAEFNGIDVSGKLAVGSTIIIPNGEIAPAPTTSGKPSSGGRPGSTTGNPYRGGSGAEIDGYYDNPVPGAILTQSIHGWNGVDLGAQKGTPILAAAAGTVIIARSGGWNGGYGSYVVIAHGNGTQTLYGHMSRVAAHTGDDVVSGQTIGYVGSTGESTGPHLHFEVRGAKNPFAFCPVGAVCQPR